MANSIQQAKIASTPSEKVKTNELAGRVRIAFAEYEASAEQSTIHMFSIPNGARLLSGSVAYDALGSSTTLSVDNGRLKVLTTNTSYGSANQTVTGLTVGQRYTFQTNMYYGNASLVTVLTGAVSVNSGWQSADFLWTYSFTAGSTSLLIDCQKFELILEDILKAFRADL